MIRIGLTSFAEHKQLTGLEKATLFDYASHLPLVELDTAYYGIPRVSTVEKWIQEVPESFQFVVKVYQGISGQGNWHSYYSSEEAMIAAFLSAMNPFITSGKLFSFLIQFPAQFKCTAANVSYLFKLRNWFKELPVAIELRDASWYSEKLLPQTRAFMMEQNFSLAVIDEPQILNVTVPLDGYVTNSDFTLLRFHGRNAAGWQAKDADWRKKRTLYRYNSDEIQELAQLVQEVANQTKQVGIIFNNNSGGDAAENALALMKELEIEYTQLNPKQLGLF